jgi:hypothetical protein
MAEGLLWYFPNALAAVAAVSKAGNDQHNPGEPMHHARGKSMDHADCIMRHLVDAGTIDTDGQRHSAKVAWRALALLQEEIEREDGVPLPRNARSAPNADIPAKAPIADPAPKWTPQWLADNGLPAESSYLASFSPNGSRIATADEVAGLRESLSAEQLREYGIGDVEPATLRGIPDSFIDSHGNRITRRDVTPSRHSATNVSQAGQHPMAAEAIRDHDERLNGPEDQL